MKQYARLWFLVLTVKKQNIRNNEADDGTEYFPAAFCNDPGKGDAKGKEEQGKSEESFHISTSFSFLFNRLCSIMKECSYTQDVFL